MVAYRLALHSSNTDVTIEITLDIDFRRYAVMYKPSKNEIVDIKDYEFKDKVTVYDGTKLYSAPTKVIGDTITDSVFSSVLLEIFIVLFSPTSSSKAGSTFSSGKTTIWLSFNISDTLVLVVITSIS